MIFLTIFNRFFDTKNYAPMSGGVKAATTSMMASSSALFSHTKFLQSLFPLLRDELATALTKGLPDAEAAKGQGRIRRLFDHTMADGKFSRSGLALRTYMALQPSTSEEQLVNTGKVAATIEMLQTFFLIEDDLMDHGVRRRGKPCWHTLPGVGLTAINDGLLLDCGIDAIIRRTIPGHPRMHAILKSMAEAKQKSVIGQMLDTDTKALDEFTWGRYAAIVEHKTSHYSYFLPLTVGMHLADFSSPHQIQLQQIAYRIGHLFQAQDDFLDCFGDPALIGKSNLSDLAEGKCTWVTCALVEKLAREGQPEKLREFGSHFGKQDEAELMKAREIICDQAIDHQFEQFQAQTVEELRAQVSTFPIEPIRRVLHQTVEDIVNRQK